MKKVTVFFLLLFINLWGCLSVCAQKNTFDIINIVASKKYIFTAESAYPARGGIKQLSSGYNLTVTGSKIVSDLPFYGEAQSIPIGGIDPGIKFTSEKFEYKSVQNKKGWQITIKPNDATYVYQLILTIYNNGTADLDVMSTNRDNMSFSGYVR